MSGGRRLRRGDRGEVEYRFVRPVFLPGQQPRHLGWKSGWLSRAHLTRHGGSMEEAEQAFVNAPRIGGTGQPVTS
jgi:hypothetical protein